MRILLLFLALSTLGATSARGSALPPAAPYQDWLNQHCKPLIDQRVATWGDVAEWRAVYMWQSPTGYLLDWENSRAASHSAHYCTRVLMLNERNHVFDAKTFLCSITDKDDPSETWTFGNKPIADKLCTDDPAALEAMDASPPLMSGVIHKRDAPNAQPTKRPKKPQ